MGIETIAQGCPDLRTLHMDECTRVTDMGIKALARGCRGITVSHLVPEPALPNKGILILAVDYCSCFS